MKPLYIWAGGKTKMIPKYQISPGIPYSGYDTFVEPFFGGGAMMVHMYKNNPTIKKFVMNDINEEIIGLYRCIKNDVNSFIKHIDTLQKKYIPLSKSDRKSFYYDLRQEYITDWKKWTETKQSAVLYFLMKTGFNGIWQTTKESKGRFATPAGLLNQKSVVYDKENVLSWNEFLQKVDIHSGSWETCIDDITGTALYFMDPPYRDSFTSYGQDFDDTQQLALINTCKELDKKGHLVMVCNRDAGDTFYTDNKGSLEIEYYEVTYTAGRRKVDNDGNFTAKSAKEILMYSSRIDKSSNFFEY